MSAIMADLAGYLPTEAWLVIMTIGAIMTGTGIGIGQTATPDPATNAEATDHGSDR